MSKPAGKCVFCGGVGLTKGHVWPDWLNDILPRTASHHEHEIGKFYTFDSQVKGPEYSKRTRQGHARSRKPRNTCARCNSGWMSNIESLAKHVAVPLIENETILVSPFGQTLLASLLCLIAMRLEFLSGGIRSISPEERDWLRYYREPSQHWRIWIAQFGGEKPDEHWARSYGAQLEPAPTDKIGPEYCNVQVSTLFIGQLCAHIFYSVDIDLASKVQYEGIELATIWPQPRYEMNSAFLPVLDDKAVLWLHEAFARESKPMPPSR